MRTSCNQCDRTKRSRAEAAPSVSSRIRINVEIVMSPPYTVPEHEYRQRTGSTDDAWERHGLFRCGAFIAARSHRPSINIRKSPPEHLPLTIAEAMRRSVVTHHRQLKIYSMTEVIWLDRPVIRGPPADRLVQAHHPAVTDSAVRRSTTTSISSLRPGASQPEMS